jgi:hypothetical protein
MEMTMGHLGSKPTEYFLSIRDVLILSILHARLCVFNLVYRAHFQLLGGRSVFSSLDHCVISQRLRNGFGEAGCLQSDQKGFSVWIRWIGVLIILSAHTSPHQKKDEIQVTSDSENSICRRQLLTMKINMEHLV